MNGGPSTALNVRNIGVVLGRLSALEKAAKRGGQRTDTEVCRVRREEPREAAPVHVRIAASSAASRIPSPISLFGLTAFGLDLRGHRNAMCNFSATPGIASDREIENAPAGERLSRRRSASENLTPSRRSKRHRSRFCDALVFGEMARIRLAGSFLALSPCVMLLLAFHYCRHVYDAHWSARISAVPRQRTAPWLTTA